MVLYVISSSSLVCHVHFYPRISLCLRWSPANAVVVVRDDEGGGDGGVWAPGAIAAALSDLICTFASLD